MNKKITFLIIFLILLFSTSINIKSTTQEDTFSLNNNYFKSIYDEYGVIIITDTDKMIPKYWEESPINGTAHKLPVNLYDKAIKIIRKALDEYPKKFIKKHLNSIAICSYLSFYGIEYGGTAVYMEKKIIISIKDYSSISWKSGTIHHELNHLLVYNNIFPKKEWASLNKNNFVYGDGGVNAIKNGKDSLENTEASFIEGFICEYGKSALIEDIATLASYIIMNRKEFMNKAYKYGIIQKKFYLLKKFYEELDPDIDDIFWVEGKIYQ